MNLTEKGAEGVNELEQLEELFLGEDPPDVPRYIHRRKLWDSVIAAVREERDKEFPTQLRIESADGGFVAHWEGLPITTQGGTWGEALEMAFDAGREWVSALRREGNLEKVMRQMGYEDGEGGR